MAMDMAMLIMLYAMLVMIYTSERIVQQIVRSLLYSDSTWSPNRSNMTCSVAPSFWASSSTGGITLSVASPFSAASSAGSVCPLMGGEGALGSGKNRRV